MRKVLASLAVAAVAALPLAAAPAPKAEAIIQNTVYYRNITGRTLYIYTGNGCTGTRVSLANGQWSARRYLSKKSSIASKARTARASNTQVYSAWANHPAGACITVPQYSDPIFKIEVDNQ